MDILTIVRIVFWVLLVAFVAIYLLTGLKRGIVKAINRFITIFLAVVLAIVVGNILINAYGADLANTLIGNIKSSAAIEQFDELFTASPTLEKYLPTLALHLVAPILFFVLFIVFAIVTAIISAIINIFLKKLIAKEREHLLVSRLVGMGVNALVGLFISLCLLMPFAGYLVNAGNIYARLENEGLIESSQETGAEEIVASVKGAKDDFTLNMVSTLSSPLFMIATNYSADGMRGNAVKDIYGMLDFVPPVMNLSQMDFNDFENVDLTPFKDIINAIGDNDRLKAIIAEILSYASGKWLNNEPFMGLNIKEQLPEDLKIAFDPALLRLRNTTKDTVKEDLTAFVNEIERLQKVYPSINAISGIDFSDLQTVNVSPFNDIADAIGDTVIVKEMVVAVMREAGSRWLDGNAFLDINIEQQLPEDLKGCLKPAYETLADTSAQTVVDDIKKFVDVFESIQKVMLDIDEIGKLNFSDTSALEKMDTSSFYNLAEHASLSSLGSEILSEILSRAGANWKAGKSFMDMNFNENMPSDLQGVFNPAFDLLASSDSGNLKDNLLNFAALFDDMKIVSGNFNKLEAESKEEITSSGFDSKAIRGIASAVDNAQSSLTAPVVAGLLAKAGTNWKNAQPFLDVNIESFLKEDLRGAFIPAYEVFAATNELTVVNDINDVAELFENLQLVFVDVDKIKELDISTIEALKNLDTTAFHSFGEHIACDDELSAEIMTELVRRAGNKWSNDGDFLTMTINTSLPLDLRGCMSNTFAVLANTTEQTVGDDLHRFALLFDDLKQVAVSLDEIVVQKFDYENLENIDVSPFRALVLCVRNAKSDMTADVVSKIVNKAGTQWLVPTAFLGLNLKEQLPADCRDSLDTPLMTLANSDENTVCDDLNAFTDALESLAGTYKYFKEVGNDETQSDIVDSLAQSLSVVTKSNKIIMAGIINNVIRSGNMSAGLPTDAGSVDAISGIITGALDRIAEQNAAQAEENKQTGSDKMSDLTRGDAVALNSIFEFSASGSSVTASQAANVVESVLNSQAIGNSVKNYTSGANSSAISVSEEQKSVLLSEIEKKQSGGLSTEQTETLEALKKLFAIN